MKRRLDTELCTAIVIAIFASNGSNKLDMQSGLNVVNKWNNNNDVELD